MGRFVIHLSGNWHAKGIGNSLYWHFFFTTALTDLLLTLVFWLSNYEDEKFVDQLSLYRSDQIRSIPWQGSRRGDMVVPLCDSERQARLPSAQVIRVELSILVHSFRASAQHFTCRLSFLPPSSVPCSTVLVRLLWRVMWPNHASFLLHCRYQFFLWAYLCLYLYIVTKKNMERAGSIYGKYTTKLTCCHRDIERAYSWKPRMCLLVVWYSKQRITSLNQIRVQAKSLVALKVKKKIGVNHIKFTAWK